MTRFSSCSWRPETRLRLDALPLDPARQVGEAMRLPVRMARPSRLVPAGVAAFDPLGERAVLDHLLGDEQRPRAQVHRRRHGRASRSSGSIDWRRSLASKLRPPRGEAAALHDLVERERDLLTGCSGTGRCPSRAARRRGSCRSSRRCRAPAPARSRARRCGRRAVAWFCSMLTLTSFSRPCAFRKP